MHRQIVKVRRPTFRAAEVRRRRYAAIVGIRPASGPTWQWAPAAMNKASQIAKQTRGGLRHFPPPFQEGNNHHENDTSERKTIW